MTQDNPSLERLRREIDHIDDKLHDLVMERAALVERIAAAKSDDGVALRPGREAQVLRRIVDRHAGPFPRASLVRMWRELMGALVGLQRPFTIACFQPERGAGYIDLARNHFGVAWPLTVHQGSPGQVVRLVADGQASVGIVPLPGPPDAEPWWLSLTSDAENLPRVVARLPFLASAEGLEALVIACRPHEPTGDDRTLAAIETLPDVSRDRMRAVLTAAGLEPTAQVATHRTEDMWLHLVELSGHAVSGDGRFDQLVTAKDPVRQIRVIGGYAVPVQA
jgi:chorismate mutase-like protein